jgi:hypothetical protein
MIVSHKHKFVFIGLPFSASSAISKELFLMYEGRAMLAKHSLYYDFLKHATTEELNYFVFAVLRNPMEIVVTVYEKMKANAKGNFTNPQLFSENGGHITKKHREKFNYIQQKNASFQQYFIRYFNKPYDNLASITVDNCDYIIRHENIEHDYVEALKKVGIKNPRPLPVANKTAGKKNDMRSYYTDEIKEQALYVFAPFLKKYNYSFPEGWGSVQPSVKSTLQFKILSVLRKINYKYFKNKSEKVGLAGTIYGDIQRQGGKKAKTHVEKNK